MHVVVRSYSEGASDLFSAMEEREDEVRELIGGVPGFRSYAAFRSGSGVMTVTVCDDKAGTDESSTRAANWIGENVDAAVDPPQITEGDAFIQF